ncbi:unnamed protein product [Parajaminaea phylloscopi]
MSAADAKNSAPPKQSFGEALTLPLQTSFQGSSALWWPCSQQAQPDVFVLFIPGNPGLSSYYIPYLSAIHSADKLHGRIEILSVSHRGHSRLPLGVRTDVTDAQEGTSLQAQIRQKIAAVEAIRSTYPKRSSSQTGQNGSDRPVKLVLIGHSVGAYIALKVLEELGDQVDGLQLLFPTIIDIARTPKGSSLPLQVITSPLVQSLVLPFPLLILSLVPSVVLLTILQVFTGMTSAATSTGLLTTLELVTTPGALLNAASMARDEFKEIQSPEKGLIEAAQQLKARGGSLHAYWSRADEDSWAPSSSMRALESALSLSSVGLPPSIALPARSESSPRYAASSMTGLSDFSFPNSAKASLSSRTLQIGGTLTRAAGRKLAGVRSSTTSIRPSGRGSQPAWPYSQGSAGTVGRSSTVNPLEDLFASGANGSEGALLTSPTKERRRIIPLTPSSPSPRYRKAREANASTGEASASMQNVAGSSEPMSPVDDLTRRRRLSMAHAKARRSIDGSITLELPKGEDWSFLADSALAASRNSQVTSDQEDEDEEDQGAPGTVSMGARSRAGSALQAGAATSTVCKVGMPHAFCLQHGEDMGRISAYWILRDYL